MARLAADLTNGITQQTPRAVEKMSRFESEQEMLACFDEGYLHVLAPVMLEIEAEARGTDYGSVSWSSRDQVERMATHLDLGNDSRLLDIGAGAGWPGLYVGQQTGCHVTMLDFPVNGLKLALDRAAHDSVPADASVANGASLPFSDGVFEGVIHSDLLCCLSQKREVLAECRRMVRSGGRMAFGVIEEVPDLAPGAHTVAVESGPEYVETESPYPDLLAETGWTLSNVEDVTSEYGSMVQRLLRSRESRRTALVALLGVEQVEDFVERNRSSIASIEEGRLCRRIYLAEA